MIAKQKGRIGQHLTCSLESAGSSWGKRKQAGRKERRKEGKREERDGGSHLYHLEVRDGNPPDSGNIFKKKKRGKKKGVSLASTFFFFPLKNYLSPRYHNFILKPGDGSTLLNYFKNYIVNIYWKAMDTASLSVLQNLNRDSQALWSLSSLHTQRQGNHCLVLWTQFC